MFHRSNNKSSKEFNLRTLFRLASNHKGANSRRKTKKSGSSGVRPTHSRSISTHLTGSTTNRSSIGFLLDPVAVDNFPLGGELAAFEETKEEIVDSDELGANDLAHNDCASNPLEKGETKPQHRAPESYFEMTKNENEELGNIKFEFDSLEEAQAEAARRQRPILCIEAELPGDIETGQTIFSHPLIVEAAECLFVTVHPRQLEPQDDENDDTQHRRFFCNSSCRTRVRILDDKGIDVLTPVEHMSTAEVVSALVRGLESYRVQVPQYLKFLLEEETGKLQVLSKTRFREIQGEALFGMFDSVHAEVELAGMDGVLSTRSGALVRQQVVRVTYDSRRLSYGALVRHALRKTGANVIYYETNDERIAAQLEVQHFHDYRKVQQRYADDVTEDSTPDIKVLEVFGNVRASHCPKPALRGSILRFVPLTSLQSTQANRLIHFHKFDEAMHLLSPRQGLIAMQALRAHHSKDFHDVVDVPICDAWHELCRLTNEDDILPMAEKLHYVMGDDLEQTESLSSDDWDELEQEPLPLIQ